MTVPQQTSGELDLGEPQQRDSNLSNSRPTSETLGSGELPCTQNTGHGPTEIEKPFSIYTNREKWYMVGMAALAGLFSPLASSVYFPAIPTMADAFNKSIELINLTVTMYMVFQGISPMLWGGLADRFGRRPVYLACLSLLLLSCVGLALVPTNAYWLLMVLRCFQAAGSASMIALGAGVISDIATPAERGGFMGLFTLGPMIGPCIGPIIGGLLSGGLGWRSMFWFLTIATGLMLVFMILTFPETLRAIVGDGSRPPQKWNRTPITILGRKVEKKEVESDRPDLTTPRKSANPLRIFRVFTQPDILLVLICTGIIYSLFYSVTTTTSPLFLSVYPYLTQSTVGLCFIAYGVGGALGSVVMGKLLDYDWRKMEGLISGGTSIPNQTEEGEPTATKPDKQDLPIEHTRLKRVPILFVMVTGASVGYGWSIQQEAHLAVPLVLQFVVGFASMSIMTINQTILVDMYPAQGSSITASNNFVRCLLGAGTISIQDFVINAINPGWTYVLFCGICLLTVPLFVIEWRYGAIWRRKRASAAKR
ncbi:putative transporter AQR1 OS=Saccharomyces cerevisiae (strain ATCC 204508 / S288c) GN=AQR1 PE=1 SV=1 [Rhizoctonia solani AG-1 IB]|uniref:Putative transporter AQR1 n=1 Tax=Thanatephorus cucumeris (strain AG1-IB / isolate 7/3/14) TaxID=1108050 RepID=A0A0B7FIZ3_THACB|nr:putative transporter AQR1 OS=Saccharomyces cerevisiae (strain ATCC 204508 / S288c) GN=AQR1 PE=1 SV=1 [Rhizoctonia solani AG-1 IB]